MGKGPLLGGCPFLGGFFIGGSLYIDVAVSLILSLRAGIVLSVEWEGHPEVAEMIKLQQAGLSDCASMATELDSSLEEEL